MIQSFLKTIDKISPFNKCRKYKKGRNLTHISKTRKRSNLNKVSILRKATNQIKNSTLRCGETCFKTKQLPGNFNNKNSKWWNSIGKRMKKLRVKSVVLDSFKKERLFFWINVDMGFTKSVFRKVLNFKSKTITFHLNVLMKTVRLSVMMLISKISWRKKCLPSIRIMPSKHMQKLTEIQFAGVRQLTVGTCSSLIKEIHNFTVLNARSSTAWTVDVIGIKAWHAQNTKFQILKLKLTNSFWNLLQEKNSSNVQSVNFGWKKTKDVITWRASVNLNFVISAEVFTWSAIVLRSNNKKLKEEWLKLQLRENKCKEKKKRVKKREKPKERQGQRLRLNKNKKNKSKKMTRKGEEGVRINELLTYS